MKGKKRISLFAALICVFALVFSLGLLSACGTDEGADIAAETADGATWYYGTSAPAETLGKDGDFYLDTASLLSYQKSSNVWQAAETVNWYYGTAEPNENLGVPYDFYLNTKTGELYQKGAEEWGSPILTLKGEQGKPGRDGVLWFSGEKDPEIEDPALKDAIAGDFYLNNADFTVWQLTVKDGTNVWAELGSLKPENGHNGTRWFEGTEAPAEANTDGAAEGDFYFRSAYIDDEEKSEKYQIYRYESGNWVVKATVVIRDLSAFYGEDGTSYFQDNGRTVTVTGVAEGTTELTVPGELNGKPVSIADKAFAGRSLRSVTIEEGVTSVGKNAFQNCTDLTDVTWNVKNGGNKATKAAEAVFAGCTSLERVTFGDAVELVPKYAFYGCTGLQNVTFGNNLTTIGYDAFRGCTNLSDVTLPESLTVLEDYVFYGCKAFTEVTIPANVNRLGSYAFYGCDHVTSVTIDAGSQLQALANIGVYSFHGCTMLQEVSIGEGVGAIGKRMFSNCTALQTITIPDGVTEIGELAFNGSGLTEFATGNGVQTIGVNAFDGCGSLASVAFGKSVGSIGDSAFKGCTALSAMTVDAGNETFRADGNCVIEKNTEQLVLGCKDSVIPAGVASIGEKAFFGVGIASVEIPASVTEIGKEAFSGCNSMTSLHFVSENSQLKTIGTQAFYDCTALGGTIAIPDSVQTIGGSAFNGCESLAGVTIGNGVETLGLSAFNGCTSLTNMILGDNLKEIGQYAFNGCAFESITIPASVTSIARGIFSDCLLLQTITYGGTVEQWKALETATGFVTNYFKTSTVTVICTAAEGGGTLTYTNGVLE